MTLSTHPEATSEFNPFAVWGRSLFFLLCLFIFAFPRLSAAEPGDAWSRIDKWCTSDGRQGSSGGTMTRGTCADAAAALDSLGGTIKDCTDFIEQLARPNPSDYISILIGDPVAGNLVLSNWIGINAIVWDMGVGAEMVRMQSGTAERAFLPDPSFALPGAGSSSTFFFMVATPGDTTITPGGTSITDAAGDFELIYGLFDGSGESFERVPQSIATLNFQPVNSPTGAPPVALGIELLGNHPNPFNPATVIDFGIESTKTVSLRVYSIDGRFVRTLLDARLSAGDHSVLWDGTDEKGSSVVSGVYVYRLVADGTSISKTMALLK